MGPEFLRALQNKVDWSLRDAMARALAELSPAAPAAPPADAALLEALKRDGLCRAPRGLDAAQCAEALRYFEATACFAGHVPAASDGVPRLPAETARLSTYGSYRLEQSLAAPHLIELALHPGILALAGAYLGCLPLLYSINTFWTFPGGGAGLTHGFHRDEDDYRFLAVFLYLTDVEPGEGELCYIDGTHNFQTVGIRIRPRWRKRVLPFQKPDVASSAEEFRRLNNGNGYGYDAFYERMFAGYLRNVSGPGGTAFAADTFGLHRGTPPRSRARLVTWFRYGLYENVAYKTDGTEPVPASRLRGRLSGDPLGRAAARLVIDWSR
jgi:hypothetical protein